MNSRIFWSACNSSKFAKNMLKIALGWRRDFCEEQLRKNRSKIQTMIDPWPVNARWNRQAITTLTWANHVWSQEEIVLLAN